MNQQELEMEMPQLPGATEIQNTNAVTFVFKNAQVRTTSQGGEPWFVLKDVCEALGIVNVPNVAARLDPDEKNTIRLMDSTSGGNPNVTIISEPGLYSVIFRSDKPEAQEFKRWIRHEVLPTIRKTGSYSTPKADVHMMKLANQTEGLIKLATLFGLKGNMALISASNAATRLLGVNPLQIMDIQLESETQKRVMTPTELGRELEAMSGRKHSARMVNEALCTLGYQIKTAAGWEATPAGQEFSRMMDAGKARSNGTPIQQLKWDRSILEQLKGGVK